MKVFLSAVYNIYNYYPNVEQVPFVLESYAYVLKTDNCIKSLRNSGENMLDSGAFTFLNQNTGNSVNWNAYVNSYINFINSEKIDNYIELDIDKIVGYENVKKIRSRLEQETHKKCIPVWHRSRGLEEWENMCKNYELVAIGGFVMNEIKRTEYNVIPYLLSIAKKHGTKVHGLGFTSANLLRKYKFNSVDSTSWINSGVYGSYQRFNGEKMVHQKTGRRLDRQTLMIHSFNEWRKYQDYAKDNL